MARAQKPGYVFRRNGRALLNRRGRQSSRLTGSRGMRISGSNAGCTMFRGSVKGTGYPLHSSVFPSLPLPCVTVCHHISSGVYRRYDGRAGLQTKNLYTSWSSFQMVDRNAMKQEIADTSKRMIRDDNLNLTPQWL